MQKSLSVRETVFAVCMTLVVVLLAAALPAAAAGKADNGSEKSAQKVVVDINSATVTELTELPGIGPAMAQRIVEFREQHGDFKRVEDLLKVKGIGEKSFAKLRPSIKVSRAKSK